MPLVSKIILIAAILFFVFVLLPELLIGPVLYLKLLVRTSPKKWGRGCSETKDTEQLEMYRRGMLWGDEHQSFKHEVAICNDGLKLYGEYFDFGFNKAVIIVSGRSEGCTYSYYYAKPYKGLGYNVLVIDNRCNGLSEGKILTCGLREYTDILEWGRMLHEKYSVQSVLLHGLCMGAATCLYVLTNGNTPDYYQGIIVEGMYTTFYDSFRNHIIEKKHKPFPAIQEVFFLIKHVAKVDAKNNGPVFCIGQLKKPILFLHSKQDLSSLPQEIEKVYELCKAPKKLVWFEKGVHSHIRINNEAAYDQAVIDFAGTL